jgi:redox-sensitive bicupin YhaK (pirin superfamily)
MKILSTLHAHPTQDGDGVKISRIHDFRTLSLDPFLMIDSIRSDDQSDYVGGFPPHPHRGIETFTYMIDGGFEHKDQMGNIKAIRAGDVQWMSTGYGVVHSEMPLIDETNRIHGFQIWLNMPASEKLRPARYQDTVETGVKTIEQDGVLLRALAGEWQIGAQKVTADLNDLAGSAGIADLRLEPNQAVQLPAINKERVLLLVHSGTLAEPAANVGTLFHLDPDTDIHVTAGPDGLGALVLYGEPINENIVHMGPFVMNTDAEIQQAILDYQTGKFGQITV